MSAISAANFVLDAARTLLRGEESSESLDVFDPTPEEKMKTWIRWIVFAVPFTTTDLERRVKRRL